MAPSATSPLHPIVISAVKVPPHFTTLGTGLLYESHPREPANTLKTLLLSNPPLLTNKSKPKTWWRGQCLLYGLDAPPSRTIQELRTVLETALAKRGGLVVPDELVELEYQENGKFRKLNAQVREATGASDAGKEGRKGKGREALKTQPELPKATAAKQSVGRSSRRGEKATSEKNHLKTVKGAPKISKAQPAKKSAATTKQSSTKKASTAAPKPRTKQAATKKTLADKAIGKSGGSRDINAEANADPPADGMDYEMDYEADDPQYRAQMSRINDPEILAEWYDEQNRVERERQFYGR